MANKLLIYTLVAGLSLGVLYVLNNIFYLAWTVWWFDNILHFSGGVSVSSLSFWILSRFIFTGQDWSLLQIMTLVFMSVLIIGIGWEIFEYVLNISDPSSGETYWQDTTYDLVADLVGSAVVSLIIYKKKLHG